MPTVDVKDLQGRVTGSMQLPDPVFVDQIKTPLLWETVKAYLANRRQGTVNTKTRGDVRGGGRKPWRQKGTGRARQGSIRSPLWRGGGVVFGPHPRDYRVRLPKTMRHEALLSSLEVKWREGAVTVIQNFQLTEPKTKSVAAALKTLKVQGRTLILLEAADPLLARAARNIPGLTIKPAVQATSYDVLAHRHLVVSEAGLTQLQQLRLTRADASPRASALRHTEAAPRPTGRQKEPA